MSDRCRNCEHPLDPGAQYCPSCGQKVAGLPTLGELFTQFLGDVYPLDAKFWRTYGRLVARPGRVTRDYLEGKRQRYVRPLRLYLVNSLVFFLVATWSGVQTVKSGPEGSAAEAEALRAAADSLDVVDVAEALEDASFDPPVRLRLRDAFAEADFDSTWIDALAPDDSLGGWFEGSRRVPLVGEYLEAQGRRVKSMSSEEFNDALNDSVLRNLPKAIFAMVPVFAGILALVYRRRRRRYVEHFVFALHGHALAFLVFTVLALVEWTPFEAALLAALGVHAVLSLRTVYGQGWVKTVVKAAMVGFTYSLCLLLALLGAAVVALLTI